MTNNEINQEEYKKRCEDLDKILIKSGIRDICIKCSTIKPWEDRPFWLEEERLGCCGGCPHLTKKGCNTIGTPCKLWLCNRRVMEKMLKDKRLFSKWNRLEKLNESFLAQYRTTVETT